jgi:hypothetical protein
MFVTTLLAIVLATATVAAPKNPDVRDTVKKGLKWLAEQQDAGGSWSGSGGMHQSAMTGFAGVALLMEGSTLNHGQFAGNLRTAVEWYEKHAQENGLLVPANSPSESTRYMLGHGFSLLFLACAHDTDDDPLRRKRVAKLLAAAVDFAAIAQTKKGGWGYLSASDGADFDEANSTIVTIQGLLAARKAGIQVPDIVIDRAMRYLATSTNGDGGVIYSQANGVRPQGGDGRPAMTAGAAAMAFMAGGRRTEPLAQWLAYSNKTLPVLRANQNDYTSLYHHYFMARAVNALGEVSHRALDATMKDADLVKWSAYRAKLFPALKELQDADGSWPDAYIGRVYTTSMTLTILQLDNNYLPAFSK